MNTTLEHHAAALALARRVADALLARGGVLATAESCTGGLIAACCTEWAGSSQWFERGEVTYSNEAKVQCLGVPEELIDRHGAVSEAVARAMAEGLLARCPATVCLAVTGIAGPGGGSPDKPVGTVWLAWAATGQPTRAVRHVFAGDRADVRWQAVQASLGGMLTVLGS